MKRDIKHYLEQKKGQLSQQAVKHQQQKRESRQPVGVSYRNRGNR